MFNFKVPTYLLTALMAGLILSGCPSENTESGEQTTHSEQTTTETTTETKTETQGSNTAASQAPPVSTIGKLNRAEFDRLSAEGGAAIAGVKASGKALSAGDKALLIEIANSNLQQVVQSMPATSAVTESVRVLAEAEVMKQRGLASKLQELATAGQVTLPSDKDPKLMEQLKKLQAQSGPQLEKAFINNAGISGNQKFEQLMSKVQKQAADPALKQLATAMLPQIKQHLQISRDILAQLPAS